MTGVLRTRAESGPKDVIRDYSRSCRDKPPLKGRLTDAPLTEDPFVAARASRGGGKMTPRSEDVVRAIAQLDKSDPEAREILQALSVKTSYPPIAQAINAFLAQQ